jgi:hypothetical protein
MVNATMENHHSDEPWNHIVVVLQSGEHAGAECATFLSSLEHRQSRERGARKRKNTFEAIASLLGGTALVVAITFGLSML